MITKKTNITHPFVKKIKFYVKRREVSLYLQKIRNVNCGIMEVLAT